MIRITAQCISWITLVILILSAVLYLTGGLSSLERVKLVMTLTSIIWFISTPLWMWKGKGQ